MSYQLPSLTEIVNYKFPVSGAGRGIGFKLVEDLAARPNTVIFAGVRSFPLQEDHQLAQLAAKYPEIIFPVKVTSADEEDNKAAAAFVREKAGKVDVVIANAG
jgi:NAD(P)-dependent dehydrogenase (short-subunit alcohol dehydrogenase family)